MDPSAAGAHAPNKDDPNEEERHRTQHYSRRQTRSQIDNPYRIITSSRSPDSLSNPPGRSPILALAIMSMKTVFTLATGNTFVYFVQPVFTDATVAALFLGSLYTARPLVARIGPDFYPVDAELAARPRIRQLFRRLTLLWGLVYVVKGSLTLWLLLSMSTVNFVLIKSSAIIAITLTATAATIALSVGVARQEGLFRPAPSPCPPSS